MFFKRVMNSSHKFLVLLGVGVLLALAFYSLNDEPPKIVVSTSTSSTTTTTSTSTIRVNATPIIIEKYIQSNSKLQRAREIVDSRDSGECDTITDPTLATLRDMCHYTIAVTERNQSKCEGIRESGLRKTCVDRIKYFLDPNRSKEIINTSQSGGRQ